MERLYNNILLPDNWPPKPQETTLDKPLDVPYLHTKPDTIDISVGRQLFVDDFLIADTDLNREEGVPTTCDKPLLTPETDLELNAGYCTCACPFNGGVFYDASDRVYKMWYEAGWFDGTAYAQSEDGLHWKRLHELNHVYTDDRVLPRVPGRMRDGDAVWLDTEAKNPDERYKLLSFYRCFDRDYHYYPFKPKHAHDDPTSVPPKEVTELFASPDGLRNTADKRAGSVKSRQRTPTTRPKNLWTVLWRSQSRWSFHSENDSPLPTSLLSRCRAGCRGKSLISGLFPSLTTKTTEK